MTAAAPAPEVADALAEWRGVAIRYPHASCDAVGPVSLAVRRGERVLLLGPSGCGKSTLLQSLTGIVPRSVPATIAGTVALAGREVGTRLPAEWSDTVAQLFQDADQTLCGFRVADEIAFHCENRGLAPGRIRAIVADAMAQVGLPEHWRDRRIATLSGGEKQLVAMAAVLAQDAPLFVADEPTASLAPAVAARMGEFLMDPRRVGGVLLVDHRLAPIIHRIDRVVVLDDDGRVLDDGPPRAVFQRSGDRLDRLGIWTPLASRLARRLARGGLEVPPPLTMEELCTSLAGLGGGPAAQAAELLAPCLPGGRADGEAPPVVSLQGADCAPAFGPVVLRGISLELRKGAVLGVLGANGAGKSTLAACLAGLVPLRGGQRSGPPGAVAFQNAEAHFTQATALDELRLVLGDRAAARASLSEWGLHGVAGQHPFTLSQGQKRRLALALLTASDRWPLLVLDEPTAGLDARGSARIAAAIGSLAAAGRAVTLITHDMDFAYRTCDRIAVIAGGGILAQGPATQVMGDPDLMRAAGLARPELCRLQDWIARQGC